MKSLRFGALAVVALASLAVITSPAVAQDVVTVGTVTSSGSTVDVPVYIRDLSGTPLGIDRPAGSKIQSFSIKVSYAPASAVASIGFSRAGITAGLTPTSEFTPASAGSVSLLDTFSEASSPIPFTLNAGAPGNLVAHLTVNLSAAAQPGTAITLTLDPSLTQLTDSGGSAATKETSANGQLSLVNGAINIAALSLSLAPGNRSVTVGSTATLVATISAAVATSTTITLTSSAPGVATVPATVTIAAGARTADFQVSGIAIGSATITAALPNGGATAQSSVTVQAPAACTTPAIPELSAPATAGANAGYTITWLPVTGATDYLIEESTDDTFATSTSRTVATPSATYSHATGNLRYYYRVRAHNGAGACDTKSEPSAAASVLIDPPAQAPVPVLTVVGSVPGNFGSYFKTSVQLYNPRSAPVSGRIVFHPQGVSGTENDPALAYVIGPGKTLTYADLLPAMGIPSGLGTADLLADPTSALPLVLARIFNDGGVSGTTGLAEEIISSDDALHQGDTGALIAPADLTRFRLNIGIRTLTQGATIAITVRTANGDIVKTTTHTYDPTYFVQISTAALLDGHTLTGGETLTFEITAGTAILYGATTDNTTNDPSVQFARRID
jgi:uncharacterized protein YjdB